MMDTRSTDTRTADNRSPENMIAGMMTTAAKTKLRAGDTELKLAQPHAAEHGLTGEARTRDHNIYEIYAYTRAVDDMRDTLGHEQANALMADAHGKLDEVIGSMSADSCPERLAMEVKPRSVRRADYGQGLTLHKASQLYIAKPGIVGDGHRRVFMYDEIEQHFDIHDDWK